MPDDYHPPMPRRNPEDFDLGRIQTDLEFLIERVSRLPTRKEQALKPLYVMVGSAGIVIAFLATLPLSHAGLLEPDRRSVSPRSGEPHSHRLAIRHSVHCHAVSVRRRPDPAIRRLRCSLAETRNRSLT
jgi:hypothetical protein